MKLFLQYLFGKRRTVAMLAVFFAVFFAMFALYHLPLEAVVYPSLLCLCIGLAFLVFDFCRVKRTHQALQSVKSITDAMAACFPSAETVQERDYQEIIRLLGDEHDKYRVETNLRYKSMIDYYTVWAHQIKTPIASMRLNLQSEDSALSRKLSSDLFRIEQYADMVLTFLRLDSASTDYVFKEYDLDTIIKSAVKKFSSEFILRRLSLEYQPLNATVVTDEKWLSFVIEQVLSNALKYTPSGSIKISLVGEKTLRIEDTGIGIAAEDLPRIFENGYTGYNGRADHRASGIGLYLSKRICDELGHGIKASSVLGVGTTVDIDLSRQRLETE